MANLMFSLVLAEMAIILILLFKSPFRNLVIMAMDRVKQGRGPAVAKTIAGTFFVFFASTLYNIMKIKKRSIEFEAVIPTDQILIVNFCLDASFMGYALFLAFMIDRLHYYIRELWLLRKSLEMADKQNQLYEESLSRSEKKITGLGEEIYVLKSTIKEPEPKFESETEARKVKAPNATGLTEPEGRSKEVMEED